MSRKKMEYVYRLGPVTGRGDTRRRAEFAALAAVVEYAERASRLSDDYVPLSGIGDVEFLYLFVTPDGVGYGYRDRVMKFVAGRSIATGYGSAEEAAGEAIGHVADHGVAAHGAAMDLRRRETVEGDEVAAGVLADGDDGRRRPRE